MLYIGHLEQWKWQKIILTHCKIYNVKEIVNGGAENYLPRH